LLDAFSQWLREQGRSQIEQAQYMEGYYHAFPEYRSDGGVRLRVLEALQALQKSEVLRLPVGKGGWDPAGNPRLPRWVTVVRERQVRPDFSSVNWLPALSFAVNILRSSQLEKLRVVNKFLIERSGELSLLLPFRERALEIFGDEKAFDGMVKDGMLFGQIPLAVIGACDPEPPFARQDFLNVAGPMLVLENHHTYWSMSQWNRKALRYRSIGYGSGNTIVKSARAMLDALELSGATHLEYLGDLDPAGVSIAATIDRNLRSAGGGGLTPAKMFYQWMLDHGKRRPLTEDKRTVAGSSIEWFEDAMREQIEALFKSQCWVPQESLSLRVLFEQLWDELPPP